MQDKFKVGQVWEDGLGDRFYIVRIDPEGLGVCGETIEAEEVINGRHDTEIFYHYYSDGRYMRNNNITCYDLVHLITDR